MRVVAGAILLASVIGAAAPACAHQVNISTARVEVRPQRMVAVEVALKGSDVDRVAGTHVFDEQTGTVDAAKVAAAAAPIAAYVGAHVSVTGADGAPCVAGAPEVTADGDGVITRNTFSCAKVAGDLVYHSTVLTASNSSARQVVLLGVRPGRRAGAARRYQHHGGDLGAAAVAPVGDAALPGHRHRAHLSRLRSHRLPDRDRACGRAGCCR